MASKLSYVTYALPEGWVRLCSLPRLGPRLAAHDATGWSFKSGSASASGAFLNWVRLSAMILVDSKAALVKVEYWTTSRCTRARSLCNLSLKVCSSVISLSISCTEVVVARCYRFATQLAMSGGDRTERRKAKAHEITKSCDYDFAADGHLGSRRALATVVGVLGFRGRH